jgi:C4-dicarboxylate transporter DctQ subunit
MARLIQLWHRIEENILALLLVSTTLLVFIEVVLRFGFGTGFMWSQELTLLLSAWFVLFGISYGLRVGAHIGVDVVVRALPPRPRRVVSALALILSLVYCGLFLFGTWIYLAKMKKIGIELEDIEIPAWQAHSILLIGLGLFSIRLLELLWGIYRGTSSGFQHVDEAEESLRLAEELQQEGDVK